VARRRSLDCSGRSALFVVAGLVMHGIFVRILKNGATEPDQENHHE
jgi:hypothetical protein